MTKKDVFIHREGSYAILMAKDHFHGIEVQIVKYVEGFRVEEGVTKSLGQVGHVVWKRFVPTTRESLTPGAPSVLIDPAQFKKNLAAASVEAKVQLAGMFLRAEEMVDGSLNDYRSANRELDQAVPPSVGVSEG